MRTSLLLSGLAAMSLMAGEPQAAEVCQPLTVGTNGPYDYRLRTSSQIAGYYNQVIGAHFTESVRRGERGNTAVNVMGDLSYVLNRFPNHPEALMVVSRVQRRPGFSLQQGTRVDYRWTSAECFLERARIFAADDPVVWGLSAIHYQALKKFDDAEAFYRQALKLSPDNPEIHYNLGLLYADREQWPQAREHAEIAYQKGYPLPGLRDRLKRANAW